MTTFVTEWLCCTAKNLDTLTLIVAVVPNVPCVEIVGFSYCLTFRLFVSVLMFMLLGVKDKTTLERDR